MPISSGGTGHVGIGVDTSIKWMPEGYEQDMQVSPRGYDSYLQRYLESHPHVRKKEIGDMNNDSIWSSSEMHREANSHAANEVKGAQQVVQTLSGTRSSRPLTVGRQQCTAKELELSKPEASSERQEEQRQSQMGVAHSPVNSNKTHPGSEDSKTDVYTPKAGQTSPTPKAGQASNSEGSPGHHQHNEGVEKEKINQNSDHKEGTVKQQTTTKGASRSSVCVIL